MQKFRAFSINRPYLFGLVMFVLYAFLTALAFPVHFLFPDNDLGQLYGDAAAKLVVFCIFLLLLWRFGWIDVSGIARTGTFKTWLVALVVLVYSLLTQLFAFTGSLSFPIADWPLATANLVFALSTSLVEESLVRGLVLVAMMLAWGSTKTGQVKAVLFSASLFGLMHLINLMIRPPGIVFFQAVVVMLPGIFYAAFVLTSRSLWPAIVIHWLGNAVVNIKLIGNENYQETPVMWLLFALSLVPLLAYSAYLVRGLPRTRQLWPELEEQGPETSRAGFDTRETASLTGEE